MTPARSPGRRPDGHTSTQPAQPKRAPHLSLGDQGERHAGRHLVARGLVELDRNWRCEAGEIDLVMLDGSVVVAVEVKTRRGVGRGHPVEAVDQAKLDRLHALVWRWLTEHGVRATGVRVDLVGIVWPHRGTPTTTHVRGVA